MVTLSTAEPPHTFVHNMYLIYYCCCVLVITCVTRLYALHRMLGTPQPSTVLTACTMQEEKRHEASLKRIALAEKAKAQKEAQDLEAQRQQELQVYNEAINTGKVFGQVLFELFVKALSSTSVAATTSQKEKKGSKPKPEDERAKQQARFL